MKKLPILKNKERALLYKYAGQPAKRIAESFVRSGDTKDSKNHLHTEIMTALEILVLDQVIFINGLRKPRR